MVTSDEKLVSYRNAAATDIKKCCTQFASSSYSPTSSNPKFSYGMS
jgi:hypothetical protein